MRKSCVRFVGKVWLSRDLCTVVNLTFSGLRKTMAFIPIKHKACTSFSPQPWFAFSWDIFNLSPLSTGLLKETTN